VTTSVDFCQDSPARAVQSSLVPSYCSAAIAAAPTPVGATPRDLPTVSVRGAWLHAITEQQCVATVLHEIEHRRGGSIHTMNLDHLRRFLRQPSYAARYSRASIITADGMPLIWASRLRGTPLPERVTGSNLIWSLSAAAAQRGRSIYLLGGASDTAKKAASVLMRTYPNLRIAGTSSESIEDSSDQGRNHGLVEALALAKPDIVYVALGSPKQEEVMQRLREMLPATWWLGVGAAFSFVAGEIQRAPLWMQRIGLEWFHRLMQEPRRLAKRYLIAGLPFGVSLLCRSIIERFSPNRNLRYP
jgi:N-acetylglucosaminyldiphosphoundecaprenol N-acetyl-beta-D-mannosaminyltransferase